MSVLVDGVGGLAGELDGGADRGLERGSPHYHLRVAQLTNLHCLLSSNPSSQAPLVIQLTDDEKFLWKCVVHLERGWVLVVVGVHLSRIGHI